MHNRLSDKAVAMNKVKHFIIILITIFMVIDIGLKVSILDALDKKRAASKEQEAPLDAKNSKGAAGKIVSSVKSSYSKSSVGANQKSSSKFVSKKSSVRGQVPTKSRTN